MQSLFLFPDSIV